MSGLIVCTVSTAVVLLMCAHNYNTMEIAFLLATTGNALILIYISLSV